MDRFRELFAEYHEPHGMITAKNMARERCIDEMLTDLSLKGWPHELSTDEKLDKIIGILELMRIR
jgi:hypothetical protein